MAAEQMPAAVRTPAAPVPPQGGFALVIAFALAIHAAGFTSLLSHPVHIFIPALAVTALFLAPNPLVSGYSSVRLLLAAALLAAVILSAVFGANPGWRAIGFALFPIVPLFGLALLPGPRVTPLLAIYAAIAVLAMAVWTWLLHAFLGGRFGPWGAWTPAGTANLYGLQFNMLWPVLLFAAHHAKSGERAGALRALAAIAFLLALLTFSRAAIATAFASALFLLIRGGFWRTLGLTGLAVLMAGDRLIPALHYARLADFKPDLGRAPIWSRTLEIARDHLFFGVSPGGAAGALADLQVYHAHNNMMNLLLESGVAAAVLFVLLELWLAWLALKLVRASADLALFGCAIGAWLAAGQAATTITNPELTITLALIAAAGQLEMTRRRGALQP